MVRAHRQMPEGGLPRDINNHTPFRFCVRCMVTLMTISKLSNTLGGFLAEIHAAKLWAWKSVSDGQAVRTCRSRLNSSHNSWSSFVCRIFRNRHTAHPPLCPSARPVGISAAWCSCNGRQGEVAKGEQPQRSDTAGPEDPLGEAEERLAQIGGPFSRGVHCGEVALHIARPGMYSPGRAACHFRTALSHVQELQAGFRSKGRDEASLSGLSAAHPFPHLPLRTVAFLTINRGVQQSPRLIRSNCPK